MAKDKVDELYDALAADGIVTKGRDNFRKFFFAKGDEGYKNRNELYKSLKADGLVESDSYEEFRDKLGLHAVKPAAKPQGTVAAAKPQGTVAAAGTPLSDEDKRRMSAAVGSMVNAAQAGNKRAMNRMDYAQANTGIKVKPVKLGENRHVVETTPKYNLETGKQESTYITESGNEFENRSQADLEQNAIDEYKYSQTVEGQLREAEAESERLSELMRQRMEEIDSNREGGLLRELADESHGMPGGMVNSNGMNDYRTDERFLQLEAAARKNRLAIQTLKDKRDGKMNDFWHSLGTTMLNGYTLSDGLSDMNDATAVLLAQKRLDAINRKREAGQPLTKEEEAAEAVLRNFAINEQIQGQYGGEYGAWSRAGSMAATSIDLMKDIMLTPGAGGIAKGVAAKTAQTLGKGVSKVAGEKVANNIITKGILKGTGILVGAHTAGAVVSNTGGIGHTGAAMGREMAGNVTIDDNGNYGIENQKDLLHAFVEAERQQAGENGSEMFGKFIPGAGGLVKKGLEKIGLSKISNALTNIGKKNWYKQYSNLLSSRGYNGIPGEAIEEYEGMLFDAMTGNAGEAWENIKDPRTHIDIWLGCATMGALLGAVPMTVQGAHTAQYYRYKHKADVADKVASYRMTSEKWEPIREQIDMTENGGMTDVVMDIANRDDLHVEEKKAAIDYVRNLMKMRGYNIAQANNANEDKDADVETANEEYSEGYGATGREDMRDVKNRYDLHRERVSDLVDDGMLTMLDSDPVNALSLIRDNDAWTDEEKQVLTDYVNAKAAYDGMLQGVRDDIDSRMAQSDAMVNSRVNPADGMLHPAKMKENDREVYVIGGNIVMNDDGTMIDNEKSDESIIVRDAETGKIEFADPRSVLSIDATLDAEQVKQEAREDIRQSTAQQAANNIDGILPFNAGDNYTLTDEQGQQHTVTVVPVPEGMQLNDGDVLVSYDGVTMPMPRDYIQNGVENTNLARLTENETERAARLAAEPQGTVDSRPVYSLNDEITLQTDEGPVRGSITAEENEDGLIEVYTERPVGGNKINLYNRDELDGMLIEQNGATLPQSIAPAAKPQGTVDARTLGEQQGTVDAQSEVQQVEPMPMVGEGEEAEPDFTQATPQRAHTYIYNEAGLDRDEANQFVEANKKAADKALSTIQGKKPKMGTSLAKYRKETAEWQQNVAEAQAQADYWKQVKDEQQKILAAEAQARAERDAAIHEQAIAEEQLRQEEELRKREEQAQLGSNNVAPQISEKWNAAPKVEGARNELVLANGEKVAGRYVLVESGAATPSHNPVSGFAKNEGFPVDENEQSVNDRDYERDQDAQAITRQIAGSYDSRALQTPVVVSSDGVVLSGNGRTMAGELAAIDGTDGAYIEHLKKYGGQYGFTPEQIEGMAHPRVLFVPDEAMPYTAETFAKFNQQEMKGQSKSEQAVKLGKIVDDGTFGRIINSVNAYDTLGDFYADTAASTGAIQELLKAGAISQAQYAEMFDGDTISSQGKEMLENMLIGKAFESNPDAVREITAYKSVRQSVICALAEISNNLQLKDYSLQDELAQAIDLVYQARNGGGYKAGERVSSYARQLNLFPFDEGESVADYTNATVLMLADVLNDNRVTQLKKVLTIYNHHAQDAANGQMDLFTGGVESKEEILNTVKSLLYNGTEEEQQAAISAAVEQRTSAAEQSGTDSGVQQDGVGGGRSGGREDAGGNAAGQSDLAQTEFPQYKLSDEVDENGRQFVFTSNGNIEFGHIGEDTGLTPAPILLSEGVITNPNTNAGYGLVHIEARHGEQIRAAGYGTVLEFIEEVAKNYEVIREGNSRNGLQTYMLQLTDKHNNTLMVELSGDGTYWNINTAGIFKTSYGAKRNVVYNRHTTDNQSAETDEASLSGEQSGTTPSTRMNAPTQPVDDSMKRPQLSSSDGKGTKKTRNNNELDEKNVEKGEKSTSVAKAEAETEQNPTDGQKEAGNYKKGHVKIDGFDISIENPKGSERRGKDASGKPWSVTMNNTYGYIRRTEGVDGDHIDVFLSDHIDDWNGTVYVVDQINENGSFDEHKVMYGFNSEEEARDAYLSNYAEGWQGLGTITGVSKEEFKKWIDSSHRKTKAFAEYAMNRVNGATKAAGANDDGKSVRSGKSSRKGKNEATGATKANSGQFGLVSDARMAELKERLRQKMLGQMNMGIDPEILTIGIELTAGHIDRGIKAFADYAKAMIEDLGDAIRPYLKAFYNGARDLPEIIDSGLAEEMTPYDEVRRFDVANFDKQHKDAMATAEQVVAEQEAEKQASEAVGKIKEIAKKDRKRTKKQKNDVPLHQEADLFGSLSEENNNVEQPNTTNNGLQRNDAVRSEGLPADNNHRGEQTGRMGETPRQESDRGGQESRGGGLRPDVHDGLRLDEQLSPTSEELDTPANPKNTKNNHAERGTDYAPKAVDARIQANIRAIELMQELVETGEKATPEQMAVLRQFSGWGGLGKAFDNRATNNGKSISQYLKELLGDEAYQQANMSRNSAYYTPANVIDTLWDIARAMGFKGGKVLEGSAGIGNILGLMPTDMSERSDIYAVEIDGTTGNILSLLYPDAQVDVQGFEATPVENGSIDLAITNVPFVTGLRVNDTTGDKDLSRKFRDIHDFCIAKNIRKLRDGGIGIFITSSGTLDNSTRLREWIVGEGAADVVGAFRLNNETFGGTGATSDIIVVRKRVNSRQSPHAIDVSHTTGERVAEYDTGEMKKVKGVETPIIKQLTMDYNQYLVEHPEMMAGKMLFGFENGDTFRPTSKALYPVKGKNQDKMLSQWADSFAKKEWEASSNERSDKSANVYEKLGDGVKEGSMVVDGNGVLCIAQRGEAVPLSVNANKVKGHSKAECFQAYKAIKDALSDVLEYQTTHDDNAGLQPLLDRLNKSFDSFVQTYGHLHKNPSISFLKNDVDFANILALEKFSERADVSGKRIQEYGKTDIFSRRVVEKEKAPEPKNVKDGIIASIYVYGRIDVPYISEHLGMSEDKVKAEIIKSGLGFENPVSRQMEVSYEYLSGNVREKLQQAMDNNQDGRYNANIKALEKVIPMNIPAHLIDFNLGSSWIAPKLYEEYVKEKTDVDVIFTPVGGTWLMKAPHFIGEQKNRAMGVKSNMFNRTIMGTQLIEAAMQNRTITISETHKKRDGSTETITDKEATQACANKIDEIRQDFKDWARAKMQSDTSMAESIERIYNDMFNNYVPKNIPDEFVPQHFSGQVTELDGKPFSLRPHQGKAVVRGTTQPLLLAHEVGTGKTYTLISTAMEMRRLGTARKPMIVVQNSTVGQFVESAKEIYPNAKVLTLEDKDHTSEGRKNFYAKIKYNDWDMIVVPQSVFERIPDSEERQMKFVHDKIEEKMLALEQMREAANDDNSPIVRQAEREISKLEDELAALTNSLSNKRKERDEKKEAVTRQNAEVKALEMLDRAVDDVENFDDMGVDAILVDEAHEYKHLGFATAMQRGVKGVDPSYSKKAQGVYLKAQAVLEKNHGRNVIFATGTPISNTAAEIWTFMRYLMPADTMKEYDIYYFDDFVRNFGNLAQMLEFTTSGKFKENNRFAGYVNLPELVRIWSSVSDTVLTREAGGVKDKIPQMEGDKAQDIYLPQTRALRSVMKFVKKQLNDYDKMSGKQKKENSHIPLTMYGIAKAAAVDARLVVTDAADEPQSKTNEAVRQILRSLEETASYNGTVALFADNYQNKNSGFNLYDDIREKLIAAGVPEEQIVIMKSGMSVKKKLEIFDKVNRGEVRVIMGSTFTLGTGVNIQERLHTLIHLDAPNRPMDYTQRNGRILRQGNIHKDMGLPVRVLRFGVEDSLDVTAYQRLKTKGAIADSIMNGKQMMQNSMENRALEEEEDVFGDTVAQLSGSEYAMLKNQAEKDVRKYTSKKKQWEDDQTYCHNEIPRLESQIKELQSQLDASRKSLATVEGLPEEKPITIGKQTFTTIESMADFLKDYNKKIKEVENELRDNPSIQEQERRLTVNVGGIDFAFRTVLNIETRQEQGTLFSAVHRKMTYSCEALGLEDVPVRQSLLREGIEDIVSNIVTGNDFREDIERFEINKAKAEKTLSQIKERDGKPFEFSKELKQAKERFEEYSELMKKELEEKEAKYADMDAEVEELDNDEITVAEEASEEEADDDETRLREGDDVEPMSYEESLRSARRAGYTKKQHDAMLSRQWRHMREQAENAISRLGLTGRVTVLETAEGLKGRKARAKGWYDAKTGKIVVVMSNHHGPIDIMRTILHEGVAHYGLRALFGSNFDRFLDNVFQYADASVRSRIVDLAKRHGWDFRVATEEYLASLAEDTDFERADRQGWWSRIKSFFLDMLHSIGLDYGGAILTDNELRYILWRSYENLAEPGTYRNLFAEAADVSMQARLKVGNYAEPLDKGTGNVAEETVMRDVNERFNRELSRYHDGVMDKSEMLHLGKPQGVVRQFLPDLPIVMRQRILNKGSVKKHNVDVAALANMPQHLSSPIFIFQRSANTLGVLTEMQDRDGKNVCVAIELNREIQNGGEILEVNDIRSVHGRNVADIVYPIVQNGTLKWADKEKGLAYLSSASRYVQQEIDKQDLDSAAKVIENFENPKVSEENFDDDDEIFFRSADVDMMNDTARAAYDARMAKTISKVREAWQDGMTSVNALQEEVLKQRGETLVYNEDSYRFENQMHGINRNKAEYFERALYKPIIEALNKLCKQSSKTVEEVMDYMMAKHGLERNVVMAERAAQEDYIAELQDNPFTTKTLQDFIAERRKMDYGGLTGLYAVKPAAKPQGTVAAAKPQGTVAAAETKARQMVDAMEQSHGTLTNELWAAVNAATSWTLRQSYESGEMTREQYNDIRSMYKNYIPLRGWDEVNAHDVYDYVKNGAGGYDGVVKTAHGRGSKADNPIAHIGSMGISSIIGGSRNMLKRHLFAFAVNHPSSLLTVSQQWYRNYGTKKKPDWRVELPDIPENATADEISDILDQFEKDMEQLEQQGIAKKEKSGLSINYRATSQEKKQHTVQVRINGKDYVIYVNGNPRAAQAINGDLQAEARKASQESSRLAEINRWMAENFTSKNPAFIFSNAARDITMAMTVVGIKENGEYNKRFYKNLLSVYRPRIAKGGALMPNLMSKYKNGTLDTRNEVERYFKEFMDRGAETGFTSLRDVEEYKKRMAKELARVNDGKVNPKKALRAMGDIFEHTNRCVEDATRFVTYMTSRQMGRNVSQSVDDAKNVTLNFNRKGSGAMGNATFRNLYIFVNPAIQSLQLLGKLAKEHPVKTTLATAIFITAGAMMPMLNLLIMSLTGGDDDDYWNLPAWVRRNNLVVKFPYTENFVTIPLAQEFRVFYGLGEYATACMLGHGGEHPAMEVRDQFLDLLPLSFTGAGGNVAVNFAPTLLQPLMQLDKNIDFTGKPIWRENQGNEYEPSFQKAYSGTPKWLVKSSELLNDVTGGDAHRRGWIERNAFGRYANNPAIVNHLLKGYFGGMYTFVAQSAGAMTTAMSGESPKVQEIPIANRFVNRPMEREQSLLGEEYWNLVEKRDEYRNSYNKWSKDADNGIDGAKEKISAMEKTPEYKRYDIENDIIKDIEKMRTGLKNEQDEKTSTEMVNDIKSLLEELRKVHSLNDRQLETLYNIEDGDTYIEIVSLDEKSMKERLDRMHKTEE